MANTKQAKKRVRQADRRRAQNKTFGTKLRTFIKNVQKAIARGNKEEAKAAYNAAVPVIDKAVNKGAIHKNKAARHKSRLNVQVKEMS